MSIIYFLIAISLFMALVFLGVFLWASFTGQHNDLHTPPLRMLFDDDKPSQKSDENHN